MWEDNRVRTSLKEALLWVMDSYIVSRSNSLEILYDELISYKDAAF